MHSLYVYLLKCADGTYYTGVTNNVERRFQQHQAGIDPNAYTHSRRPLELVWALGFQRKTDAIAWEKRIKRWSKAKKEALIRGEWYDLIPLSKKKFD